LEKVIKVAAEQPNNKKRRRKENICRCHKQFTAITYKCSKTNLHGSLRDSSKHMQGGNCNLSCHCINYRCKRGYYIYPDYSPKKHYKTKSNNNKKTQRCKNFTLVVYSYTKMR
jgi:hypothetical protein